MLENSRTRFTHPFVNDLPKRLVRIDTQIIHDIAIVLGLKYNIAWVVFSRAEEKLRRQRMVRNLLFQVSVSDWNRRVEWFVCVVQMLKR